MRAICFGANMLFRKQHGYNSPETRVFWGNKYAWWMLNKSRNARPDIYSCLPISIFHSILLSIIDIGLISANCQFMCWMGMTNSNTPALAPGWVIFGRRLICLRNGMDTCSDLPLWLCILPAKSLAETTAKCKCKYCLLAKREATCQDREDRNRCLTSAYEMSSIEQFSTIAIPTVNLFIYCDGPVIYSVVLRSRPYRFR